MSKPNWKKIQKEWETTAKTYRELSEQFNVNQSTIRSRKNREKWERNSTNKKTKQRNAVATKKKGVATKNKKKEPVVKSENLTDKQRLFCIYYIKYFNATKAYQKAYECAYSTAMSNGHSLLRNTEIISEIERLKEEQTSELMLDVRDVLQKYIDIAFADITDFTTFGKKEQQVTGMYGPIEDDEGNPVMEEVSYVEFKDSSQVDGTIITEVKQGRDGISVKLADKMKALEMLSKYFDLLSDSDKERYQLEKLKAETAKVKAETEKISGDNDTDSADDWIDALEEVARKRRMMNDEQ